MSSFLINSHRFGGGGLPAEDGIRRSLNNFTGYTNGGQTVSASTELGTPTFAAWKAFDGTATAWLSVGSLNPAWIKIDFGQPQVIYSLLYNVRNDTGGVQSPRNFTIDSSDDDSNWTTRLTVVDGTRDDVNDISWSLSDPAEARYWRLHNTLTYGENRIGLQKMEWYS